MTTSTATTTPAGGFTLSTSRSCRIKFARRFLRSLAQIKRQNRPSSLSSEEETCKRSKKIKMAAYFSMARTVGPRMKWSRALIFKLRNQVRYPKSVKKKKRVVRTNMQGFQIRAFSSCGQRQQAPKASSGRKSYGFLQLIGGNCSCIT